MNKTAPIPIEFLNGLPHINDVRFSRDGTRIIWSESFDGQGTIFDKRIGGKTRTLSGNQNVRGGVGYGGGDFDSNTDCVVFPDRSGSLFITDLNEASPPKPLSPAWGSVASPALSPDGQWVLYCYTVDELDGIAITRTRGISWPAQLVLGADFYMHPTWHPSGLKIAWVEWNHPDMPWDASVIKLGEVGGLQPQLLTESFIAGGEDRSASQPRFSPNGEWLSYIIRDGDWDSLVLYDLKNHMHKVLIKGDGFHLRQSEWIQGMRSYVWNASSTALYYLCYSQGRTTLWKTALSENKSEQLPIDPLEWAVQMDVSPKDDAIVFLGSSPRISKQICLFQKNKLAIFKSNSEISTDGLNLNPVEITFPIPAGNTGYGFFYPAMTPVFGENTCPPLILHVHGGPTSAYNRTFSSDAAYFTSRGFAYAQVNYHGSSGYGYSYQEALRHKWGLADTEDVIAFAAALVAQGFASPDRMVLMGSSAGGFTVLNTLIRKPGLFKAGICSYGVSDLLEDARNTHKFEKYYHRFLIGDLKKNHNRFIDRSPINHVEKIKDPVALFHGDEDKVVSLKQTLAIYEQLVDKGVPCELKVYAGEGHGFRKSETQRDCYERIEAFLKKHLSIN